MSLSRGDQATLRHAAKALDELAADVFASNQVDGKLKDAPDVREHADLKGTASRLREIARYGQ